MAQQFTNRKLVVIGGSSSIGRQVAADDDSAVIVGRRQGKVEQTAPELSAAGTARGIAADLRDPAELEKLQAQLAGEHADATLLVNAVGVVKPLPFLEHTAADYDRGGAIVNIGSMWAQRAVAATPSSVYSMAKGRPARHDQHLATELAGRNQ
jgi:short-subunit dehydrogenase